MGLASKMAAANKAANETDREHRPPWFNDVHNVPSSQGGYGQPPPYGGYHSQPPPQQNYGPFPPFSSYPPPGAGFAGPPTHASFGNGPPSHASFGYGPPPHVSLGYGPQKNAQIDITKDIGAIRKAMKGFGTDEKTLVALMAKKDPIQMETIRAQYDQRMLRNLVADLEKETSGYFEKGLVEIARGPLVSDCYNMEAMKGIGTKDIVLDDVLIGSSNADIVAMKEKYRQLFRRTLEADVKSLLSAGTGKTYMIVMSGGNDLTPSIIGVAPKVALSDKYQGPGLGQYLSLSALQKSFLGPFKCLDLSSMSTLPKSLTNLTGRVSGPLATLLAFATPAGAAPVPGAIPDPQVDWKERILDILKGDLIGLTTLAVPAIVVVSCGWLATKLLEGRRRGMSALSMLVSGAIFVTMRSPQHSSDDDQVRLTQAAVVLAYNFFMVAYCRLVVKKDDWSMGWTASAVGAAVLGTWVLMSIPSVSTYWKELMGLSSAYALDIGLPLSFAACEVVASLAGQN